MTNSSRSAGQPIVTDQDKPVNAAFWRGRKVLLTGHTGFKGGWMTLWLGLMGAEVVGLSLEPPSDPSLFELASVADGITDIREDIRNLDLLSNAIHQHQPDIVIHMAAQSLVRPSYDNPVETFDTNIMGTVNLLEAVRQCDSVRAVLVVTSDKCYENREWHWGYRENDPMGGYDPYSSSKGCAELVCSAYRNSFYRHRAGHPIGLATARAGNVIGGGDWGKDRLVPDAMRSFLAEEPLIIRYPQAIRPWQHVMDPLAGYLRLVERLTEEPNAGEWDCGWNFGPGAGSEQPVRYLAERLVSLWGEGQSVQYPKHNHHHEAGFLKLDSSQARTRLQWRPRIDLDGALNLTVEWFRGYQKGQPMREITERQIRVYMGMSTV